MDRVSVFICVLLGLGLFLGMANSASAVMIVKEKFFENAQDGLPDDWTLNELTRVHIDFNLGKTGNKAKYQTWDSVDDRWVTEKSTTPTTDESSFTSGSSILDADLKLWFYDKDNVTEKIRVYYEVWNDSDHRVLNKTLDLDDGTNEDPWFKFSDDLDNGTDWSGWLGDGEFDVEI